MNTRTVLVQVAVIYIAMIGFGNAAPPEPGPVPVEVMNTTTNPVPVVGSVNTSVSNFPATQDVSVTNTSSNPVPVTQGKDGGRMTLNTRIFDVPAMGTELFGPDGFQPIQVSFVNASGLDEEVMVIFNGENGNGKLVLYGDMGSGIGQEDYVFSLPVPIYVSQIEVRCLEASTSCKLFVEIVGRY